MRAILSIDRCPTDGDKRCRQYNHKQNDEKNINYKMRFFVIVLFRLLVCVVGFCANSQFQWSLDFKLTMMASYVAAAHFADCVSHIEVVHDIFFLFSFGFKWNKQNTRRKKSKNELQNCCRFVAECVRSCLCCFFRQFSRIQLNELIVRRFLSSINFRTKTTNRRQQIIRTWNTFYWFAVGFEGSVKCTCSPQSATKLWIF